MLAPWVMDEMKTADLGDSRLDKRLREVLAQFSERPTASIPAACGGFAEMTAAYRFFDNERVTMDEILAPHRDRTLERMAAQPRVIVAQDTTEIDMTRPEMEVLGAGPLADESRRGAFLHLSHAFTPDGTPLGTLSAEQWTREDGAPKKDHKRMPIEDKESHRWIDGLEEAHRAALLVPQTRIVCVADSEADIFELFAEADAVGTHIDWIVRACQNRAILPTNGENSPENVAKRLNEQVAQQPVLYTHQIHVRGRKAKVSCETRGRRQPRQSRAAEVEVRAMRITLRPPHRSDRVLPEVEVNVVLVREMDPPPGDVPVEWLLLTNLPIDSIEAVQDVIQCYCVRWMIEVLFRTLKSGCRIEERRFETLPRLSNCLAVYLIVAWRTLYVCRLGRRCPDISCEAIFEPAEWKAVYRVVQGKMPPAEPPTLQVMVRMVAQLGGYVNRRRADEPGPQTIWLGLARAHDFALCWMTFGPESKNKALLV
jgi:hypothetical protein